MARYYVRNEVGNWNIFSSNCDMYYFEKFITAQELLTWRKKEMDEDTRKGIGELSSFLHTGKPRYNRMDKKEADDINSRTVAEYAERGVVTGYEK